MPQRIRGWIYLITISGMIAIIWMVVLPRLGRWEPVRRWIGFLDAHHIDPAALFYTDLDGLPWTNSGTDQKSVR